MAKVEELHPPVQEEKEEESGIDFEPKAEITFEDFEKLQFQVGEIIACEAVKKSKKLLLSGKDRKSGSPDRIRNQSPLHP